MRIGFFSGMLGGLCLISTLHAQEPDSLKAVSLSEVVVTESYQHPHYLRGPPPVFYHIV